MASLSILVRSSLGQTQTSSHKLRLLIRETVFAMGSMLFEHRLHNSGMGPVGVRSCGRRTERSAAFVKFKGGMMPKTGQKITGAGILSEGKQGFWFAFNNWGAYGYAAKESGIAKENDLSTLTFAEAKR